MAPIVNVCRETGVPCAVSEAFLRGGAGSEELAQAVLDQMKTESRFSFAYPEDLPLDGVCALLVAPLIWNVPVTFQLGSLPAVLVAAALAETAPLHRESGARIEVYGSELRYAPGELSLPQEPALPLNPVLAAFLLSLPAFAGGELTLRGRWPGHLPQAVQAEALLAWAGIRLEVSADAVRAVLPEGPSADGIIPSMELCSGLTPLLFALAALRAHGDTLTLPDFLAFEDPGDCTLAGDFLSRLGLSLEERSLVSAEPQKSVWTAPNAFWGMALALSAYAAPGLRLANPGMVTAEFPFFWQLYNALPTLTDPAPRKERQEETPHDAPARRRILAN